MESVSSGQRVLGGNVVSRAPVKGKTPLSLVDNGGQVKRVMGFEPTTFRSATCNTTDAKCRHSNDLVDTSNPARSACAARSAPETRQEGESETSANTGLAAVVAAWPELPEAVKAGIVAVVRVAAQHS
jgi:hypothetical protein